MFKCLNKCSLCLIFRHILFILMQYALELINILFTYASCNIGMELKINKGGKNRGYRASKVGTVKGRIFAGQFTFCHSLMGLTAYNKDVFSE